MLRDASDSGRDVWSEERFVAVAGDRGIFHLLMMLVVESGWWSAAGACA